MSAAIGFIALSGQAVLNGVVMLSVFQQLQAKGLSVVDAVQQGSMQRLRTVLMTALLAAFGLLPMALSHDIGSETQRPLAIVVIGGLFTATLLTAGGAAGAVCGLVWAGEGGGAQIRDTTKNIADHALWTGATACFYCVYWVSPRSGLIRVE